MLCSPITCLSGVSLGKPDCAAAFTETRAWDSWPCSEFTSGKPCRASCYDGSSHRKHSGARALSLKEAGTFAHYFSSTLKRAALQAIGGTSPQQGHSVAPSMQLPHCSSLNWNMEVSLPSSARVIELAGLAVATELTALGVMTSFLLQACENLCDRAMAHFVLCAPGSQCPCLLSPGLQCSIL